jgi:hypothetical protein
LLIHVKSIAPPMHDSVTLSEPENGHGELTTLVCLAALSEACRDLDHARIRCKEASHSLATAREKLEHVLERAFQQQSFRPIEALFCEEEEALAVYEEAVARLAEAEGRWCALRAALAYEKELMLASTGSRRQLN